MEEINYQTNVLAGPQPAPQILTNESPKKWLFIIGGIFLVIILIGGSVFWFLPKNYIDVADQDAKDTFFVKKMTLTKGGFLIFQGSNRYGKPGFAIASTEYLLPDTYTEFTVDVFRDSEGKPSLELKKGNLVFASLFEDTDGTKNFSGLENDKLLKNWLGKPVSKKFRIK